MALHVRAVALLGLLDLEQPGPPLPTTAPETVETFGHWRVEHHAAVSVWRCLCRRSEPILVPASHRSRVRLPKDLVEACEICRNELALAGQSKSAQLRAWFERHRHVIDPQEHLDYLEDYGYVCTGFDDEAKQRTKRFVYEAFFKKELSSKQYVRSGCSNALCINPYHLCLKTAPNQKITPQIKQVVEHLLELGISAKITQKVILQKFGTKLSLSTIQGIRSGARQLLATAG